MSIAAKEHDRSSYDLSASQQLDLQQKLDFYIKMSDEANVLKLREVTDKTPGIWT